MKKIFWSLILLLLTITAYSQTIYVYHDVKDTISLDETVIYGSLRATNSTPFSFTNVTKPALEVMPGAEAAYTLSSTPSITFYSDNGTTLGYVYYRLRGIDQTRLNVTLNGIPLNEPEDQGSYFNNFPNFLSGIESIQIIRGVGLSKVGTSTFGGSLNFESKSNYGDPIIELSGSYGSNLTKMLTATVNTNKFFLTANKFSTDGYKDHSGNESWSTNYGADFEMFGQKTKLFGIVGKQENGMAWVGETLEQIYIDPRSNTNKVGERDDFLNIHNQLTFENTSLRRSKITYSIFHQYQDGWYDTDISLFDPTLNEGDLMSRIHLKFNWFGALYNQTVSLNKLKVSFGMNYNAQYRNHEGLSNYQSDSFTQDYTNKGIKQELSEYVKGEYKFKKLTLYGDAQFRYVNFKYESQTDNIELYNGGHLNYSTGATYRDGNHILRYGFGRTSREPRRSDLFGGADNYPGIINELTDESVFSRDLGYKYVSEKLELGVNLYQMNFKNEFMPTGEYGENSIALYKNVKKSYRKGIELSGKYTSSVIDISGNITISKNRYQTKDTSIPGPLVFMKWNNSILSPGSIGNVNIKYKYKRLAYTGLGVRYNGESYIDLTNEYTLPSYTVLDAYVGLTKNIFDLRINFNNLTNSLILTNGMIGFDGQPRYFVMNSISSLITLKIKI